MKKFLLILMIGLFAFVGTACNDDADVASDNISKEADNFKVNRRIVAVNNYTNDYVLTIEGWCNIDADEQEDQLEVTCKLGKDEYKKHFVGLSGLSYFVEQLDASNVSVDHYKVTFKPSTVVPDIEAR